MERGLSATKQFTVRLDEDIVRALIEAKITRMRELNRGMPMNTIINDVLRSGLQHWGYRLDPHFTRGQSDKEG